MLVRIFYTVRNDFPKNTYTIGSRWSSIIYGLKIFFLFLPLNMVRYKKIKNRYRLFFSFHDDVLLKNLLSIKCHIILFYVISLKFVLMGHHLHLNITKISITVSNQSNVYAILLSLDIWSSLRRYRTKLYLLEHCSLLKEEQ